MKNAETFLKLLASEFPVKKGSHAIILSDKEDLMVCVKDGDVWHNFTFDEADLAASPESLAASIITMVPESRRRYRDSLTHAAARMQGHAPDAPCPDGDACPNARRYGDIHPAPVKPNEG